MDGSGLVTAVSEGAATITASAGSVSGSVVVTVEQTALTVTLVPATAGKQGRDTIVVSVVHTSGTPVRGASYTWVTDRNSGWVYPTSAKTDVHGRVVATWIAGWPGDGALSLTVDDETRQATTKISTRSTVSQHNPAGATNIWLTGSAPGSGFSVDLTPTAEPPGTYYAAINWDGGYTGLQRAGSRYDRQLQFSVWDVPGVGGAEVIEQGEGVLCSSFGGEGTGRKCELEYPWSVGSTYRFEVTEAELNGGSAMTAHVIDLASEERRFVGTLRFARRANMHSFTMFVEDFLRKAEHCLAQDTRSAAIRRAMTLVNGGWEPIVEGHMPRRAEDTSNPGTPWCANVAARDHSAGLELVIGGDVVSDPGGPQRFKIPR